jgi:hypothetical protein
MNNTMKKGIMLLALAVLTAGGVFAQRVGDTYTLDGQPYSVQSVSGNTITLLKVPTLNGVWESTSGHVITFNGNTAVYNQFSSSNVVIQDAVNKGLIKTGDQAFRNLSSTGALKWSGQVRGFNFRDSAPNVCVGIVWNNCTITLNADGQTFTDSVGQTYTRRR